MSNAQRDITLVMKDAAMSVQALSAICVEENKALANADTHWFSALQDQKMLVVDEFKNVMSIIMARKDEAKNADPALKEKLKTLYADFAEISQQNMNSINRMKDATERLGNVMRRATIKAAQHQRGYSYGEMGQLPEHAQRKPISSGLSETV